MADDKYYGTLHGAIKDCTFDLKVLWPKNEKTPFLKLNATFNETGSAVGYMMPTNPEMLVDIANFLREAAEKIKKESGK